MKTPLPSARSFAEKFCEQYGVPRERYGETVLRHALYPHARWLADLGPRAWLAPDRDLIENVGRLTRWGGFSDEAREFQSLRVNRRLGRRQLRLRVSVGRLSRLFSDVMGGTAHPGHRNARPEEDEHRRGGSLVADSIRSLRLHHDPVVQPP